MKRNGKSCTQISVQYCYEMGMQPDANSDIGAEYM